MDSNSALIKWSLIFIVFIGGCEYSGKDQLSENKDLTGYELYALDVLVPQICAELTKTTLEKLKSTNGLDYEYRKFMGTPKAYNDIDGYVSLKVNEKYPKMHLYDVRLELINKCYATGSVSIPRDGNEWRSLGEDIEELKKRNVAIHTIKINDELIKLFVNMEEYKNNGYEPGRLGKK